MGFFKRTAAPERSTRDWRLNLAVELDRRRASGEEPLTEGEVAIVTSATSAQPAWLLVTSRRSIWADFERHLVGEIDHRDVASITVNRQIELAGNGSMASAFRVAADGRVVEFLITDREDLISAISSNRVAKDPFGDLYPTGLAETARRQGTAVSDWTDCPFCRQPLATRLTHAVQCGRCERCFTDPWWQPDIGDRLASAAVMTGESEWSPTWPYEADGRGDRARVWQVVRSDGVAPLLPDPCVDGEMTLDEMRSGAAAGMNRSLLRRPLTTR